MQNVHSIKYGTYIKTSTYKQIKCIKNLAEYNFSEHKCHIS